MANKQTLKVARGIVARVNGCNLQLTDGTMVNTKLGSTADIGDTIAYVEMRSLQTKVFGGRSNQWTQSTATGHKFFREV